MSTNVIPPKQDLPKEIWRVASTLSDEMQKAAVKKARELGFDLSTGRISLEETLINLRHNRDIVIDAVDRKKLVQLPLKLQYSLLSQLQKVSDTLAALINGTDTLLALEDAVDDLTASVWQNNMHNLSDQVLGFETKMNQLKAQEILIQQVHREAEEFDAATRQAQNNIKVVEELHHNATDQASRIQLAVDSASALVAKVAEQEQHAAAIMAQVQQHDEASAQYSANAKNAASDVGAIADRMRAVQPEIDNARTEFTNLCASVRDLVSSSSQTIADLQRRADQLQSDTDGQLTSLRNKFDNSLQELTASTHSRLESTANTLDSQINSFNQKMEAALEQIREQVNIQLAEAKTKSDTIITNNEAELKRLTGELASLEEGIRTSIERATGFSLFHSFQKRQIDLARSKRFWMYALTGTVIVSLIVSGIFIWSLQFVTQYNAGFFLKLSISLPLVYAIAFCSIQYGRERRLEEEYAFKSSISISLDPYQRLVAQLVDKQKPEEMAKYTAFVIESINRVFTSPTDHIFEDQAGEKNAAEKIIKAVGDVIEPIVKAVRK